MAETAQLQQIVLWVQVTDDPEDVVNVKTTKEHFVSDVLEVVRTLQLLKVPATALKLLKEKGGTPVSPRISVGELIVGRNVTDNFFLAISAASSADERKAKRLHLAKRIAVNEIADERKHIIIPFTELSACAETLRELEQKERPLIILHGSYVTGKSSILRFVAETLCKLDMNEVCFVNAVSTRFSNDGGDLPAADFWRLFGWHLFGVNDVTSSVDAVCRLRTKYTGTKMKYFLLIDEISEVLFQHTPRKEFVTFLGMIGAQGDANNFFGGFVGAGTYHTSVLLKSPETTPAQNPEHMARSQSIPNQLSLLLKSKFVPSPFREVHFIPVKPLSLDQTVKFLSTAEKESDVDIMDEVKSDIHFYAAGNLGLVAFSSHLLLKKRGARQTINMEFWEYIKLNTLPPFLAQNNRMVQRIAETLLPYQKRNNQLHSQLALS